MVKWWPITCDLSDRNYSRLVEYRSGRNVPKLAVCWSYENFDNLDEYWSLNTTKLHVIDEVNGVSTPMSTLASHNNCFMFKNINISFLLAFPFALTATIAWRTARDRYVLTIMTDWKDAEYLINGEWTQMKDWEIVTLVLVEGLKVSEILVC